MPETHIILNEKGEIRIESDYGTKTSKQITLPQLADLIISLGSEDPEKASAVVSSALPKGCVGYAERSDGVITVAIEHDQSFADVVYYNTKYENVPQPRMVFMFQIHQQRILNSYVACVKRDDLFIKDNTKLFHYPYSNVSRHHICFGSNALPKIEAPYQLSGIPSWFVSCPMNDDWYFGANRSGLVLRELLETTKEHPFNEEILVDAKKTFKELFETIGGADKK